MSVSGAKKRQQRQTGRRLASRKFPRIGIRGGGSISGREPTTNRRRRPVGQPTSGVPVRRPPRSRRFRPVDGPTDRGSLDFDRPVGLFRPTRPDGPIRPDRSPTEPMTRESAASRPYRRIRFQERSPRERQEKLPPLASREPPLPAAAWSSGSFPNGPRHRPKPSSREPLRPVDRNRPTPNRPARSDEKDRLKKSWKKIAPAPFPTRASRSRSIVPARPPSAARGPPWSAGKEVSMENPDDPRLLPPPNHTGTFPSIGQFSHKESNSKVGGIFSKITTRILPRVV